MRCDCPVTSLLFLVLLYSICYTLCKEDCFISCSKNDLIVEIRRHVECNVSEFLELFS